MAHDPEPPHGRTGRATSHSLAAGFDPMVGVANTPGIGGSFDRAIRAHGDSREMAFPIAVPAFHGTGQLPIAMKSGDTRGTV